jgi:hypothetical protein
MKKIAEKIAMILILVMLANSFSGCVSWMLDKTGVNVPTFLWVTEAIIWGVAVILAVTIFVEAEPPNETGIYLANANAEHIPLAVYYSAMEIYNSMPETERVALMEKLNSLPAEKLASLITTVTCLPQAEIAASIERLNALSETELISTVWTFNSLSEMELDALVEEINSRTKNENVILAYNFKTLPDTNIVSLSVMRLQ